MRRRWLAIPLGLAIALALWTLGAAPPAPRPGPPLLAPTEDEPTPPPEGEPDPLPPPPARNLFRYAEAAPDVRKAAPRERPEPDILPTPEAAPISPAPMRLVGFVRRAEGLRAAVATAAGVVMVGPGDVVEGFVVAGLDEDRGLRLRAADGRELVLTPGS